MYNGIGLLTARGSGTSGHVQSNSFNIRSHARNPQDNGDEAKRPARVRKADDRILEHERKREIELKLIELSESLEDNGYSTAEIEREVHEMRVQMLQEYATMSEKQKVDSLKKRDDTHALAKRKEIELERFKKAFRVRDDDEADKDAAPAQQAIDGPPERLMIENGKPQANPRFSAEEKALEEQLLREEEEEIAKEREARVQRKAERQRRKDEKAAAKAAEEARLAAEQAAREEAQRLLEKERRLAEADEQRRRDRERGSRGGHSRDSYRDRDSRGGREDYERDHRGHRHREHDERYERSHREERGDRGGDRYVEEVGTMGRHYERRAPSELERGDHKRRRVAEDENGHASRGREREYERHREGGNHRGGREGGREESPQRRDRGRDRESEHDRWDADAEDSQRGVREGGERADRSQRGGRGGRGSDARGGERAHYRDRREEEDYEAHMRERHASRRQRGDRGREDEGRDDDREERREQRRGGEGDRGVSRGREAEQPRDERDRDRHRGFREEQMRDEPLEPPRGERRNRRDEGRGPHDRARERSVPVERQRHDSGYEAGGRGDERGEAAARGRTEGRASPANSDSLSFGTSSSDED